MMGLVSCSASFPLFCSPSRPSLPVNPAITHPIIHAFQPCLPLSHSSPRSCFLLHAKKKPSSSIASGDEMVDENLRASLNEVCALLFPDSGPPQPSHSAFGSQLRSSVLLTEAVKVMLSEERKRVKAFREKIDGLETLVVKEGDYDAALFMFVIKGMLDHKVVPEVHELKGSYKKAFTKIFGVVEDSGWLLKSDDNETGVEMVDNELIPPTLQTKY